MTLVISSETPFTPTLQIRLSEFKFSYVRSSGPGGQNVNKVNSKAVLRWNPSASQSLSWVVRSRLISKLGERLNAEGDLVITSDRFRDQLRNREDCLTKLTKLLKSAMHQPKSRRETRPTFSSQRKNAEQKRHQAIKKRLRKGPRDGSQD